MTTVRGSFVALCVGITLITIACDDTSTGPELGGETTLELTTVGGVFAVSLRGDDYDPAFDRMKDSVVITRNENGLVTVRSVIGFDSIFVAAIDSSLGTTALPYAAKLAIVDTYVRRYGATLDTTNKDAMRLSFELKLRVTSEGIQDYVHSNGDIARPFTVVRYGAEVGESWQTTNSEGVRITRTVAYKSTTDDYDIAFWRIKVIKVEQTQEDPIMEKITYIANHKFGLVGVVLRTKSGKVMSLGIVPPTL